MQHGQLGVLTNHGVNVLHVGQGDLAQPERTRCSGRELPQTDSETKGAVVEFFEKSVLLQFADQTMNRRQRHARATSDLRDREERGIHIESTENGQMPVIDLTVRDLHITNLPTNIRIWDGGTERYGNSIFVFETGGLCIAHLSHLHHLLQPADLNTLGHIDIVMVAVDGEWTMSQQDAAAVVEQLQPRVVLPMHYFTRDVLNRFLDLERGKYAIDIRDSPVLDISRETLPATATVIALPGGY